MNKFPVRWLLALVGIAGCTSIATVPPTMSFFVVPAWGEVATLAGSTALASIARSLRVLQVRRRGSYGERI